MAKPRNLYFVFVVSDGEKSRALFCLVSLNQNLHHYFDKFETKTARVIIVHCAYTLNQATKLVENWNKTYKEENRYLEDY